MALSMDPSCSPLRYVYLRVHELDGEPQLVKQGVTEAEVHLEAEVAGVADHPA